jgi:hypothetical protein
MIERFWPYPIVKPESEWTAFDRDYIELMRTAFAEGFRPGEGPCGCVELGQYGVGRSASLVFRGSRNGWEPWLCDVERCERLGPYYNLPLGASECVCVRPPFRGAAHLVLEWMRGRELASLLADFEFVGGYPAGVLLRPNAVSPSFVLSVQEAEPSAGAIRKSLHEL